MMYKTPYNKDKNNNRNATTNRETLVSNFLLYKSLASVFTLNEFFKVDHPNPRLLYILTI